MANRNKQAHKNTHPEHNEAVARGSKNHWENSENNPRFSTLRRPFWTGSLVFGLVALPVNLYPAVRGKQGPLTMVDKTGTRLQRRQLCSAEHTVLRPDEIVRGYEVEKDQFITIEDTELEALEPEKSTEIALQEFVAFDEIDPIYFDKSYFLAPDRKAVKAYRLLAESMEQENRAGIATFVMRDREYLVAIISDAGLLRAETLRFYDEVRAPEDVGLSGIDAEKTSNSNLTATPEHLQALIDSMSTRELDYKKLENQKAARLKQKAQEKLVKNEDVIREAPSEESIEAEAAAITAQEPSEFVDLMQMIKARIHGEQMETAESAQTSCPKPSPGTKNRDLEHTRNVHKSEQPTEQAGQINSRLKQMTRDELYEKAQALHINGRSKMSKEQLQNALAEQPSLH